MGLAAGDLNRKFLLQSPPDPEATDAAGQPIVTWTDEATVSGSIKGQTGMGSIRQNGVQDEVAVAITQYSIRIRYRAGIATGWRIVALPENQAFDIKSVKMDYDRKNWTDLVCELGGNQG